MPANTTAAEIGSRLDRLERQLDAVGAALIDGAATELQSAAGVLRDAAGEFAALLPLPTAVIRQEGQSLQRRMKAAGKRFAVCRDNLARRAALVDRSLGSLLPGASDGKSPTYSRAAGNAAGRFGSRFF